MTAHTTTATAAPLRVVSVPASHPYPVSLHQGVEGLRVHPDPDPDRPEQPATGRWWPHHGLEPDWLEGRDFDLLHLHFGFEHRSPAQLGELAAHLRSTGRPLVLTVHDLRSPHQEDPALLDAQLDVLVPAADVVTTLTPWAAQQIRERWGVEALVHPHPPVVPAARSAAVRRTRTARTTPVVAVSCKSGRTNSDPVRLVAPLERAAREHGAHLRLLAHRDAVAHPDTPARRELADALDDAAGRGVEVVLHDPLTDDELWAEIASQDVAVLPYRFGTHSGWLEMAHDLGTHVLAPSFGGYADQGADATYDADERHLDEASLVRAVGTLVERCRRGVLAGDNAALQQRRTVAAQRWHRALYRRTTLVGAAR